MFEVNQHFYLGMHASMFFVPSHVSTFALMFELR